MPNPQAEGPPLLCSPRLLIQYIHSYPSYLEVVSSIRNLRMRHAVVTRDPSNMDRAKYYTLISRRWTVCVTAWNETPEVARLLS
jgi:hypothetical protein